MNDLVYPTVVFGTEKPRRRNICTDRQTDEQIDDQIDQRAGRADRGKCGASGKPSDNNDVSGIVKQLQDAGKHERNRKQNDLR